VRARKALVCIALFFCLALIAASCANEETLNPLPGPTGGDATMFDLGVPLAVVPSRVMPGATFGVTVTAQNNSDGPLKPGDVTLAYQGDPAFKGASLELKATAAKGTTATFSGDLVAPAPGVYALAWQPQHAGKSFGSMVTASTEVTCSDGVFCNGVERFAGNTCLPGPSPCDDGQDCTMDHCDEATGRCGHDLGAACASCFSSCVPDCAGKQCGSDGCGGSCGTCNGTCTADGQCQGTCVPSCTDRICGSDGCTGSCGTCPDGLECQVGGQKCDCSFFSTVKYMFQLDPAATWPPNFSIVAVNVRHIDIDGTDEKTDGEFMGFGSNVHTTFTFAVFGCKPNIRIKREYALSGKSCEITETITDRTTFTIPPPIINADGSCTAPPL